MTPAAAAILARLGSDRVRYREAYNDAGDNRYLAAQYEGRAEAFADLLSWLPKELARVEIEAADPWAEELPLDPAFAVAFAEVYPRSAT